MERLPGDLCLKIFCSLDCQNLATAQRVCRRWNVLASDNIIWSNLFKERWGIDHATFYAPADSKSWKDVYEVQDRCDRVGLGLKIIREGDDYYLVHQGEIQRHLGSSREEKGSNADSVGPGLPNTKEGCLDDNDDDDDEEEERCCLGVLDRILFFISDLEAASVHAKRSRVLEDDGSEF